MDVDLVVQVLAVLKAQQEGVSGLLHSSSSEDLSDVRKAQEVATQCLTECRRLETVLWNSLEESFTKSGKQGSQTLSQLVAIHRSKDRDNEAVPNVQRVLQRLPGGPETPPGDLHPSETQLSRSLGSDFEPFAAPWTSPWASPFSFGKTDDDATTGGLPGVSRAPSELQSVTATDQFLDTLLQTTDATVCLLEDDSQASGTCDNVTTIEATSGSYKEIDARVIPEGVNDVPDVLPEFAPLSAVKDHCDVEYFGNARFRVHLEEKEQEGLESDGVRRDVENTQFVEGSSIGFAGRSHTDSCCSVTSDPAPSVTVTSVTLSPRVTVSAVPCSEQIPPADASLDRMQDSTREVLLEPLVGALDHQTAEVKTAAPRLADCNPLSVVDSSRSTSPPPVQYARCEKTVAAILPLEPDPLNAGLSTDVVVDFPLHTESSFPTVDEFQTDGCSGDQHSVAASLAVRPAAFVPNGAILTDNIENHHCSDDKTGQGDPDAHAVDGSSVSEVSAFTNGHLTNHHEDGDDRLVLVDGEQTPDASSMYRTAEEEIDAIQTVVPKAPLQVPRRSCHDSAQAHRGYLQSSQDSLKSTYVERAAQVWHAPQLLNCEVQTSDIVSTMLSSTLNEVGRDAAPTVSFGNFEVPLGKTSRTTSMLSESSSPTVERELPLLRCLGSHMISGFYEAWRGNILTNHQDKLVLLYAIPKRKRDGSLNQRWAQCTMVYFTQSVLLVELRNCFPRGYHTGGVPEGSTLREVVATMVLDKDPMNEDRVFLCSLEADTDSCASTRTPEWSSLSDPRKVRVMCFYMRDPESGDADHPCCSKYGYYVWPYSVETSPSLDTAAHHGLETLEQKTPGDEVLTQMKGAKCLSASPHIASQQKNGVSNENGYAGQLLRMTGTGVASLRDGEFSVRDRVSCIGICIYLGVPGSKEGPESVFWEGVVLHYLDERSGVWQQREFVIGEQDSSCFVCLLELRSVTFVLCDRSGRRWLNSKQQLSGNFRISFPGSYVVYPDGRLFEKELDDLQL